MSSTTDTGVRQNLGLLLALASARATSLAAAEVRPFELSVRSYSLLEHLTQHDGVGQRELATALRLDPSQVVQLVDTLEARGLAERRPHPSDRRQKSVVATVAGHQLYAQVRGPVEATVDAVLADLTPAERETFAGLLGRIARPAPATPPPD